jgi:polo-like kinase 1
LQENLDTSNTEQSDGSGYILGPVIATYIRGRFLGKGGFAKCYEMTDARTQRVYAGKIIDKGTVTKLRARQKLRSEIQIHASLRHPHIVRFEHFFEDEEHVYILLELCDAQSMMELLKRRKRLSEAECRYFMMQILDAVEYMHRNRVIHRDIKLGNLFLTSELQIKIGDFGLAAKLEYDNERKRTMCGTPNYIAPEILCGKNGHSYEVDIWSLGVVLYTMLIGKPPFETADVKTTYKRIKANIYTFPSQVQISRPARDLIVSILNAAPEGRPQLSDIWCSEFMQGPVPRCLPRRALEEEPSTAEMGLSLSGDYGNPGGSLPRQNHQDGMAAFLTETETDGQPRASGATSWGKSAQAKTNDGSRRQRAQGHFGSEQDKRPTTIEGHPNVATTTPTTTTNTLGVAHMLERMRLEIAASQDCPITEKWRAEEDALQLANTGGARGPMPPNTAVRGERQKSIESGNVDNAAAGHWDAADMDEEERGMLRRAQHELATSFARLPAEVVPSTHTGQRTPSSGTARAVHAFMGNPSLDTAASKTSTRTDSSGTMLPSPFHITDPTRTVSMGDLPADRMTTPPEIWICKWVDYASKYGVGYQLSNGNYGVYFNDATKIILHAGGDASTIEYVERKRLAFGSYDDWQVFTWTDHRESLRKKVTLLRHFRQHLDEHLPPGQEAPLESGTMLTALGVEAAPVGSAVVTNRPGLAHPAATATTAAGTHRPVHLKRWMRTRHAMIFRLSNRVIQVDFFDTTQLVLSASQSLVTYRDKQGRRIQLRLHAIPNCPELVKRLRYLRDILGHLTQQQQQQQI